MRTCKLKYQKLRVKFKKPDPDAPMVVDIKFPQCVRVTENGLIAGMTLFIVIWIVIALLV